MALAIEDHVDLEQYVDCHLVVFDPHQQVKHHYVCESRTYTRTAHEKSLLPMLDP